MPGTCSATSRPILTSSTPSVARRATATPWRSPSPAGCDHSSAIARSAWAGFIGAVDRHEQAQEHFTIAATLYRDMNMPFWLEQAEAELRR